MAFHEDQAFLDYGQLQAILNGYLEQTVQPCFYFSNNLTLELNLILVAIMPVAPQTSLQLLG